MPGPATAPMPHPPFPSTVLEFQERFGTEKAARNYLTLCRWPGGFQCPSCRAPGGYPRSDRLATECSACGRITSLTSGTVLANSKTPLRGWLWAAWLMVTSKRGLSASELARQIGVTVETAFMMLHKLRAAMVAPDRQLLRGRVEVDESYIGGPKAGARGRGAAGKSLVVGAVEVREHAPGRIRLRCIPRADSLHLHKFVRESVEEGATVVTDGLPAYEGLYGYRHVRVIQGQGQDPDEVLGCFHMAISNMKAWLKGTHHGRVEARHLQAYLEEFSFRFNRRGNLGAAFQRLLGLSSQVGTVTYDAIYEAGRAPGAKRRRGSRG